MGSRYIIEPCSTALNPVVGMPFKWSLNPYQGCAHQCTFCYVRAFEKRAQRPSDDRYGRAVRVKHNIAEVLARELARHSWKRENVAIGAATDPYQPAEGRFRLTRSCIQAFGAARSPFSIITRGPLVVRDIDVLSEAARRTEVSVGLSVPTLDPRVWRLTEPHAPPPHQRLQALRRLTEAGIRTAVAMAPILPGLSDHPRQLAEVVRAAREAGATHVWAQLLYLKSGTREHFLEHLAREWPEELARYERLYADRAYVRGEEATRLQDSIVELRRRFGIGDRRTVRLEPPPAPVQLPLSL
jgi:DNA repair photolyase